MKIKLHSNKHPRLEIFVLFSVVCVGAIWNSGCNGKSGSGSTVEAEKSDDSFEKESEKKASKQKTVADFLDLERDGMAGYWLFNACPLQVSPEVPGIMQPLFVLKITPKGEGEFEAAIVSTKEDSTFVLKSFNSTDTTFEMEFVLSLIPDPRSKQKVPSLHTTFKVNGTRMKNVIHAGVLTKPTLPVPIVGYLQAVSKLEISEIPKIAPPKGRQKFLELSQKFRRQRQTGSKIFEDFLFSFEDSPLAFVAISPILRGFKAEKYQVEDIRRIADQYLKFASLWDVKNRHGALRALCTTLNRQRYKPELSIQFAKQFQKELEQRKDRYSEDELKYYRQLAKIYLENATIYDNINKVHFGSKTERRAAAKALLKSTEKKPFHPLILYALATNARKEKDNDSAIKYCSQLLVIPGLIDYLKGYWREDGIQTPPRIDKILDKEWIQKHGTTDGLVAHLRKVYEETIFSFAETPRKISVRKNQRRVLLELFTSAESPGSLSLDIATGAIARTFPGEEVVVLRYHQHTGGSNPLANADSEAKLDDYRIVSKPSLLRNGKLISDAAAPAVIAADYYNELVKRVDESLKESTELQISLQAKKFADELTVDAMVGGQEIERDWRLVLVLAEERVDYEGANDLRFHEMVVRDILTAIPGNPSQNGKLQFRRKIHISDIRDSLNDSLIKRENDTKQEFLHKPLDLKNLHVVAYVQNIKTKEVLQVSHVKVKSVTQTAPPPVKKSK